MINADIAGTLLSQAQPGLPDAEGGAYDLIAMATHGRTGLKHLLLGSVTERVFGTTTSRILHLLRGFPRQARTWQPYC